MFIYLIYSLLYNVIIYFCTSLHLLIIYLNYNNKLILVCYIYKLQSYLACDGIFRI